MAGKEKEVQKRLNNKGGLANVKKIIAVSSCKGGVGKSTVAINIAVTLEKVSKYTKITIIIIIDGF